MRYRSVVLVLVLTHPSAEINVHYFINFEQNDKLLHSKSNSERNWAVYISYRCTIKFKDLETHLNSFAT